MQNLIFIFAKLSLDMKFSIQINGSPYTTNTGVSAYRFVAAALEMGHEVFRVFFYHDAIYFALDTVNPPDDELNMTKKWNALAERYNLDLVVCISAAQRRGLLCNDELKRLNNSETLLTKGFRISGLGQLIEAKLECDRFVVFG